MTKLDLLNDKFVDAVVDATAHNIESEEATAAFKNLKTLSDVLGPIVQLDPEPVADPPKGWNKFKSAVGRFWDNETTRTLIKAGGAFGGVALVTYATIQRDHVVDKPALAQANQKPS